MGSGDEGKVRDSKLGVGLELLLESVVNLLFCIGVSGLWGSSAGDTGSGVVSSFLGLFLSDLRF